MGVRATPAAILTCQNDARDFRTERPPNNSAVLLFLFSIVHSTVQYKNRILWPPFLCLPLSFPTPPNTSLSFFRLLFIFPDWKSSIWFLSWCPLMMTSSLFVSPFLWCVFEWNCIFHCVCLCVCVCVVFFLILLYTGYWDDETSQRCFLCDFVWMCTAVESHPTIHCFFLPLHSTWPPYPLQHPHPPIAPPKTKMAWYDELPWGRFSSLFRLIDRHIVFLPSPFV